MRYVGLIGYPVAHSLSPRMQQAAFEEYGIEARYVLWETPPDTLPARIETLRAPGMIGANVTMLDKAKTLAMFDKCDTPMRQKRLANKLLLKWVLWRLQTRKRERPHSNFRRLWR